jgi:hypothetical protein
MFDGTKRAWARRPPRTRLRIRYPSIRGSVCEAQEGREHSGPHTESTRSKEVLPAFCNPIIVTSISVALPQLLVFRNSSDAVRWQSARLPADARHHGLSLPERSQKPVIHPSEEPSHGDRRRKSFRGVAASKCEGLSKLVMSDPDKVLALSLAAAK